MAERAQLLGVTLQRGDHDLLLTFSKNAATIFFEKFGRHPAARTSSGAIDDLGRTGMMSDDTNTRRRHWEQVYTTKPATGVSWYAPHLERSLELIERAAGGRDARIIDVGGGASTLVDDLLDRGYRALTVLDLSEQALDVAKARLGARARDVTWLAADATTVALPDAAYDVWHDRAVFHFLVDRRARERYVARVLRAVRPGGHVIVATFGLQGPERCSGLDVVRYDADALHGEFGEPVVKVDSVREVHRTPWGSEQEFVYCFCLRVAQAASGA
jgi:SAM-dependent methyltransferase